MAMETPFQNFVQISAKLRQLCAEGSTGTMSLATDENHHATISLKDGQVIGAAYRQDRGDSAVDKILQISAAKCSFASGVLRPNSTDTELPSFGKLLGAPASQPASPQPAPAASSSRDDERLQKLIEAEAVEYLGPMAATICAEHCAGTDNLGNEANLQTVLDRIAEEVGDPEKGKRFKQSVLNRL